MTTSGTDRPAGRQSEVGLPDNLHSNRALRGFLQGLSAAPASYTEATERADPLRRSGDAPDRDEIAALVACIDLTMLRPVDRPDDVRALAARARTPGTADRVPPVAGVAVYTDLVGILAEELADSPVRAVCPPGAFPHGRATWPVKELEIRSAVASGAQELDIVLDRGRLLAGDYVAVVDEIRAARELAGELVLKIILETADLPTPADVQSAAWLALVAGADFVKTSTGMATVGATAASAWLLAIAARDFEVVAGRHVGVKLAGGIRTLDDAVGLARIVRGARGDATLPRASTFRLGTSAALGPLVDRLERG